MSTDLTKTVRKGFAALGLIALTACGKDGSAKIEYKHYNHGSNNGSGILACKPMEAEITQAGGSPIKGSYCVSSQDLRTGWGRRLVTTMKDKQTGQVAVLYEKAITVEGSVEQKLEAEKVSISGPEAETGAPMHFLIERKNNLDGEDLATIDFWQGVAQAAREGASHYRASHLRPRGQIKFTGKASTVPYSAGVPGELQDKPKDCTSCGVQKRYQGFAETIR